MPNNHDGYSSNWQHHDHNNRPPPPAWMQGPNYRENPNFHPHNSMSNQFIPPNSNSRANWYQDFNRTFMSQEYYPNNPNHNRPSSNFQYDGGNHGQNKFQMFGKGIVVILKTNHVLPRIILMLIVLMLIVNVMKKPKKMIHHFVQTSTRTVTMCRVFQLVNLHRMLLMKRKEAMIIVAMLKFK